MFHIGHKEQSDDPEQTFGKRQPVREKENMKEFYVQCQVKTEYQDSRIHFLPERLLNVSEEEWSLNH